MIHTVLVIGATGMLGLPVAHQLKANGFHVRVLSRAPEKAHRHFGDEFEIVSGDVEDPESLDNALAGCQGVHINLHGLSDPDLERRGAAVTAQAAARGGVERVTYLSGASVCEENSWYEGTRARFLGEAAIRETGVHYTIFRAHFFNETLHNFVRGKMALLIGKHPHPYHWVAANDYARMVACAYATPLAANKTLYVCGPQALSMRQALQTYCNVLHPEARLIYMPIWMATIIAKLGRRRELQDALPFFDYCERVKIILSGSPEEANALLGAPSTTLEAWSRSQVQP